MESFTVEDLDRSSHDEVRALILNGLGEHWGSVNESLNPDLDDMLASYASGRTIVVRHSDRRIVGTGTVVPRNDATAEIVRMSVDRSVRRMGLGRRIIAELLATATDWGCESVVLETSTAWTGVVDFYLSCGFAITHVADSEFGDNTWLTIRCR